MINRRDWLRNSAALLGSMMVTLPEMESMPHASPLLMGDKIPIKISQNENPYGPSPLAIKAMTEQITKGNRYAIPMINDFKMALGKMHNVKDTQILLGSGSSEILALSAFLASERGKGDLVAANPTFKIWLAPAERVGLDVKWVPLDNQMKHDLNAMSAAVTDKTRFIYICNPNNPTGTVLNDADLRSFIKKHAPQAYIVVDEAYTEYAEAPSVSDMVSEFPNLIIAKTFSKIYGMAGLRVGYAIAQEETIKGLAKYQAWANAGVSNVSVAAAFAALNDTAHCEKAKNMNAIARTFTEGVLKEKGMEYTPSKTNFLFFNVHNLNMDFADVMSKNGILLRNWEAAGKKYARVSIGTLEEMQVFAEVFRKVV
jgi:histidinol-phosphate aminotransferase